MGSPKAVTVGYNYYMGVHIVLCHGPVDKISELIIGERSAWSGSITTSSAMQVDALTLFGGESREGGVKGVVDIMMGEATQTPNTYLTGKIGALMPAFKGVVSAVFRGKSSRSFMWSAMNPYFKSPWFRVTRILSGWSTPLWYSAKATINSLDMNPAHIVYQATTDTNWGAGRPVDDLDDANFRAVADTLYNEGFGLSLLWLEQESVDDFIDFILSHVDGVRRYDIRTGKLQLKLIRDDYNLSTIPELNPSNILKVSSLQRTGWGEIANEVTIKYFDREQKTASVTVHNLAAIDAQGGVISVTRDYPGIRTPELAARVAERDLISVSTPLAKIDMIVNRVAWDWQAGDVFKLNWPKEQINGLPFRVVKINKGTLLNGEIHIEAVQDVFKMPANAYVSSAGTSWQDHRSTPVPVTQYRAIESPYWDVVRRMSASDFAYLEPLWAFGSTLAAKPVTDASGYNLMASSVAGGPYEEVMNEQFVPTGTNQLSIPIGAANVTIQIVGGADLDDIEVGDYFYIDDEAFGVITIDADTSVVTASRGVLDTVPAAHAAGTRMFFVTDAQFGDPTERASGETVYYRMLTNTGKGALALGSASTVTLSLPGRAQKPYPPGNLKINNVSYPVNVLTSAGITLSWSHRDRTQQTVDLVPTSTGNIGPEAGVTYTVRIYNQSNTLLGTYTNATSPFLVSTAISNVPGIKRVEVQAVRSGMVSWQSLTHSFEVISG